jgi:hypothetical protein
MRMAQLKRTTALVVAVFLAIIVITALLRTASLRTSQAENPSLLKSNKEIAVQEGFSPCVTQSNEFSVQYVYGAGNESCKGS